MHLENKPLTGSEEFLSNLIDKRVAIYFKDGTDVIGTLIWDDKHAIGVRFNKIEETEDVLFYKSCIKSVRECYPKHSNYSKDDR